MGVSPKIEHVAAVGERKRAAGVLLDHQDRDAEPVDLPHLLEDKLHQGRRQTGRRLVEQQHRGFGNERARHRDHLPLAARHRADLLAAPFCEAGKERVHRLEPARERLLGRRGATDLEVLRHSETGKHVLPLRHIAEAEPRDGTGLEPFEAAACEPDPPAFRRHEAKNRLQECRLAGAVRPDHGDDLALGEADGDAVENVDFGGIACDQTFDRQRRVFAHAAFGFRPR
jgi:hypothetical protein